MYIFTISYIKYTLEIENQFISYSLDWQRVIRVCWEISYLPELNPNLKIGAVFAYSDDSPKLIILGFVNSKNNASILMLCEREGLFSEKDGYQPWLIFEIKFEKDVFVYSKLGSYFEKDEADKEFCIRQGLEWSSNFFDDYVAKLVLIGAVPPIMVKTAANPNGLPIEVFDSFRQQLAANRAQFYLEVASGPFYGFNRPGAQVSQGVIQNWWRQGMIGGAKAHYDGIKAFSETDFTEDLKKISVPTLVMHDDDQIVPIADSALLSVKLLQNGVLKIYKKFPHGMCTTHADVINEDLLAFINGSFNL